MTTPARPHGADPARDRSPARAGRRRRLRAVLTVVVAVCAAVVASVAGLSLVRSAGSGQAVPPHAAAGSGAARAAGSAGSGSAAVHPPKANPAALPPLSPAQLAGQRVIYSYSGL